MGKLNGILKIVELSVSLYIEFENFIFFFDFVIRMLMVNFMILRLEIKRLFFRKIDKERGEVLRYWFYRFFNRLVSLVDRV